jgi:hypothetical protein
MLTMSGSRRGLFAVLILLTVTVVPARADVYSSDPPREPLPEVAVPAPRIPWARRTDRWTKPMPYPGDPTRSATFAIRRSTSASAI